ncbi:MAG: hypothetical protein R3F49_14190 [Planctomycetota bacterium]
MNPEVAFLGLLCATVGFLGLAAWTGRQRRIRPHLVCVACAILGLGGAISFALQVGERYDLAAAGLITPVHLTLARVATATYLGPLITGPLVLAGRLRGRWHHRLAWLAFGLTIAATVTGAWMLLAAPRIGS